MEISLKIFNPFSFTIRAETIKHSKSYSVAQESGAF
jgi:hypothetical protein